MNIEEHNKPRPIRIYGSGSNFYIMDGGKKKKVKTSKKKKADVQKDYFKMKARMIPKKNIIITKPERRRFNLSNIYEEPLSDISELLRPDETDEYIKFIKKHRAGRTEIRKDLEQKAIEGRITAEEEKKLAALQGEAKIIQEDASDEKKEVRSIFTLTADEIKRAEEEAGHDFDNNVVDNRRLGAQPIPYQDLLHKKIRGIMMEKMMDNLGLDIIDFQTANSWNGTLRSSHQNRIEYLNRLYHFLRYLNKLPLQELKSLLWNPARARNRNPFNLNNNDRTKSTIMRSVLTYITPSIYTSFINSLPAEIKRNFTTIRNNIAGQLGLGKRLPALYSDEIEDFFKDEKEYPHFGGVIAADEIDTLPKKIPIGFVMNLDNSDKPGSHWVAVYINSDSVEYFDPLADPPSEEFKKDIKKYLESMGVPVLMKFKINKIKQQSDASPHCGFFAIKFLDDRFHGIPYQWTTRYITNVGKGEEELKKEFDYI